MKIVPLADVKTHLSQFIDQCQDEAVVVTRNGRPAAMLVPVGEGEDLERLVLAHSPRLRRLLDEADARARGPKAMSHEQMWAAVERAPARTRDRKRSTAKPKSR